MDPAAVLVLLKQPAAAGCEPAVPDEHMVSDPGAAVGAVSPRRAPRAARRPCCRTPGTPASVTADDRRRTAGERRVAGRRRHRTTVTS
ncbi:hypothetical protein ACLGIH_32185 [Streptomyces sp. HMX87]|uniref:hypothetical protein n=1 Tax=Streptomyces sp. HMX87 TaxID=3390849 RepID=UPI003A8B5726